MRAAPLVLALLAVIGCADPAPPSPDTSASDDTLGLPAVLSERLRAAGINGRPLDREGEVYGLVEVASDTGTVLLQWADLRGVVVEQRLGRVVGDASAPSAFHPTAPSPALALLDPDEVVRQSEVDGALAVLNGAFFETPGEPSTQVAYPVARHGAVVTGGSSPYGPGRPGATTARWGRPLRALGLGDTTVHVADYDPATGAPLDRTAFAEAVVSLAPDAHPNRTATRFHVLGALDADSDGTTETLLVATSDGRTTIDAPTALLIRLGVGPDRLVALDGGASVLVWNRRTRTLHRPTPAGGHDPQHLPHLLVLSSR